MVAFTIYYSFYKSVRYLRVFIYYRGLRTRRGYSGLVTCCFLKIFTGKLLLSKLTSAADPEGHCGAATSLVIQPWLVR
jgi:hypothetical protein